LTICVKNINHLSKFLGYSRILGVNPEIISSQGAEFQIINRNLSTILYVSIENLYIENDRK